MPVVSVVSFIAILEIVSGHLWRGACSACRWHAISLDRRSALPSRNHFRISRREKRGRYGIAQHPTDWGVPRAAVLRHAAQSKTIGSRVYAGSSRGFGRGRPVKPIVYLCKDEVKSPHSSFYKIWGDRSRSSGDSRSDSQYCLYGRPQHMKVAGSNSAIPRGAPCRSWTLRALMDG
jgi:hypothetical protein